MVTVIHCRICRKPIAKRRQSFERRMSLLREHYRENHPKEFRKSVKKGAKTRLADSKMKAKSPAKR